MLCKSYRNANYYFGLIGVGILSIIFGIIFDANIPEDAHNLSMLAGVLTGMGAAFIGVSVVRLIKVKISTPEKLKAEEIEKKDERNIQILRKSYTIVAISSVFLFVVIALLFLAMNYMIPAFIALGCMYIEIVIFFIAYSRISSKM